jgi:light-regulated signal transduction histidine kinase (bacteriophytochrome)
LDVAKRRVIETGIGTRQETSATGFDGREHFHVLAIDPLHDASGAIIGVTCAAIDITEYKQASERIEQLNRALEQHATQLAIANQELDSFSYSVSHDLRMPLASIDGLVRGVIQDYGSQLPTQGQTSLNLVHENAMAMSRLINDLLTFSRMSRQPLKKQVLAMGDLAREVLANLKSNQSDREVEIVIGELPPCQADPALLTQVWVNLLSNAFKFTTKRGYARIEIGSFDDDKATAYFVKDNGVGFDMEQAGRLFGVFQRLHSEEDYQGTGVGLAIVDRIVRRHGGRVWAEGEPGKGACFYFTLAGAG